MDASAKAAVSAAQIRAARALLGWSREHLSQVSGVPWRTLARIETDSHTHRVGAETARDALEAAGIEFIGEGVRLRGRP